MGKTFALKIVTPSHDVYNGNIEKLFLKNTSGELEVLANHEDMITSTVPYIMKFLDSDGEEQRLFVSSAIVYVYQGNVTICTDAAEFPEDIDFERAEKAKSRAEERLQNAEEYDKQRYTLSLARAIERLKLKK
ncbi:MAG: ATP synthase F1 subunit epsilon [Clostridium butyricum]|nr:ATP synthase F1 subunit epsilon [Clostridium butyricum]